MVKLVLIFAMLLSMVAAASGGDHHGAPHEGIPAVFYYQILNFSALLILIYFLVRKKVAHALLTKKADFLEKQSHAARAKAEALSKKNEIQARLATLLSQSEQSRVNAKTEAELLRAKLISDAQETEARLIKEASKAEATERLKAQVRLRDKLITESIASARENVKKSLATQDLERLQIDFVEKIQAVTK